MKLGIALLSLATILACGIVDFLFTNIPQRYIEPGVVTNVDLIGEWKITLESASRVDNFLQQGDSKYDISSPWTSFSLYENGTCQVQISSPWISLDQKMLLEEDAQSSCTWKMENILGYAVDGTFKDVPGVQLTFKHYNSLLNYYELYFAELYIVYENNEFILWGFIDSPDFALYQDYRKIER